MGLKSKRILLFTIIAGAITFVVSACNKEKEEIHVHNFENQIVDNKFLCSSATCTSPATYFYSCSCGEKSNKTFSYGETTPHSFVIKNPALINLASEGDCTHKPTYFYTCECGKKGIETFEYGECKSHVYDKKIISDEYLCSCADCTHSATYYYACECGEKSDRTFKYGLPLGHNYDQQIIDDKYLCSNATCTHSATYYFSCKCGDIGNITFEYGNCKEHQYDFQVVDDKYFCSEATCTHPSTYYYSCICGAKGDSTFSYGLALNHIYNQQITTDNYLCSQATCTHPATYYYSCECGGKGDSTFSYGDLKEHSYINKVIDDNHLCNQATCTHPATYYYSCGCGEKAADTFEYGEALEHVFKEKVVEDKYLCCEASCAHPAIYYYSCECGEKGDETFEYGELLEHNFNKQIIKDKYLLTSSDCTHPATYHYSCECGEIGTETFEYGEKLHHNFNKQVISEQYLSNEATCTHPAKYFYSCECGENGSKTFEYGECLEHNFNEQITDEEYLCSSADCTHSATYFYSCECGEKGVETFEYGTALKHDYNLEIIDDEHLCLPADCTHSATYFYSCICGNIGTETFQFGEPLQHTFDQQIISEQYLSNEATCTHPAIYYYSCECGEKGVETFEYGEPLQHTFDQQYVDDKYLCNEATCTHPATYYFSCECGEIGIETFEYGNCAVHNYSNQVVNEEHVHEEATCTHPASYYYSCDCGENDTATFEYGEQLEHDFADSITYIEYKDKIVEILKLPTNTEPGLCLVRCSKCGALIEKMIEPIDIDDYIVTPFIKNTGNEYINTGVIPTTTLQTKIVIDPDYNYSTYYAIFGSSWDGDGYFLFLYNNGIRFWSGDCCYDTTTAVDGLLTIRTFSRSMTNDILSVEGYNSYEVADYGCVADSEQPIYLFDTENYYCQRARFKVYSFDMYSEGYAIRSFVPTIETSTGRTGLYDLITCQFYSNESPSGEFELPEGYSSSLTKLPSNDESGIRTVICPDYPDGYEIIVPAISERYQVVECIETTGMEFIDTGLFIGWADKGKIETDLQFLMLAYGDWGGANYYLQYYSYYFSHCNRSEKTVCYNYDGSRTLSVYDDETHILDAGPWEVYDSATRICLFRLGNYSGGYYNNSAYQMTRFYSETITINDKQMAIYLPALDTELNEYGLYDVLSGRFLRNSGKGGFNVPHVYETTISHINYSISYKTEDLSTGELLGEEAIFDLEEFDENSYTPLEYIESTGNQIINTGVQDADNITIDCDIYSSSPKYQYLFGGTQSYTSWMHNGPYLQNSLEYNYANVPYRNSSTLVMTQRLSGENTIITINGVTTVVKTVSGRAIPSGNIWIFGCNNGSRYFGSGMRLYYFRMYRDNVLIRDFIPCIRNSDDVIGLYDLIEKRFYENDGVGYFDGFVKQPDSLENYKQLYSISVNKEQYIKLTENYVDRFILNGKAYDGKEIQPIYYNNQYRLGYPTFSKYSSNYDIRSLTSIVGGKTYHQYVPVERLSDKAKGLYDTIDNVFHERKGIYDFTVAPYFFNKVLAYDSDLAVLGAKFISGYYSPSVYLARRGFTLLSYFDEPRELEEPTEEQLEIMNAEPHRIPYYLLQNEYYENGHMYHLYYLILAGTDGEAEWVSNFTMGNNTSGFHMGFEAGADFVINRIRSYISEDTAYSKIIINGFSRGAAVGSIISAKLMEEGLFLKDNLSAYVFACPNYSSRDVVYKNIFQINNEGDIVACIPANAWNFYKEGKTVNLPMSDEIFSELNEKCFEFQKMFWVENEPYGYIGFTSNVKYRVEKVASLIPESAARDTANSAFLTRLFYSFEDNGRITTYEAVQILYRFNVSGNPIEMYTAGEFLVEASDKIVSSHSSETYLAYVLTVYGLDYDEYYTGGY